MGIFITKSTIILYVGGFLPLLRDFHQFVIMDFTHTIFNNFMALQLNTLGAQVLQLNTFGGNV